jgi:hypothetical protein
MGQAKNETFQQKISNFSDSSLLWGACGLLFGVFLVEAPKLAFWIAYILIAVAILRTEFSRYFVINVALCLIAGIGVYLAYYFYPAPFQPAIEPSKSELITDHAPDEICLSVGLKNTGTDNAHISIFDHRLNIDGVNYLWRDSTTDSNVVTPNGGETGELICADGPSVILAIQQHKPLEAELRATYAGDIDKRKRKFCIESNWDYSLKSFIGGYQGECPPE